MSTIATLNENIEVPENVEIARENLVLIVKGEKGTLSRTFSHPKIKIKFSDKKIKISCISPRRKDKALIGTFAAHIKNMIKGVSEGFEYKMKTVYSHFPVKTIIEGDEVVIQNFLG